MNPFLRNTTEQADITSHELTYILTVWDGGRCRSGDPKLLGYMGLNC